MCVFKRHISGDSETILNTFRVDVNFLSYVFIRVKSNKIKPHQCCSCEFVLVTQETTWNMKTTDNIAYEPYQPKLRHMPRPRSVHSKTMTGLRPTPTDSKTRPTPTTTKTKDKFYTIIFRHQDTTKTHICKDKDKTKTDTRIWPKLIPAQYNSRLWHTAVQISLTSRQQLRL